MELPPERSETAATTEEKPAPVAEVATAVPPLVQPAASEAARQKRIQNGTAFLSDSRVKGSPLSRRVNFLKSKGLTTEDIVQCFENAGQPQTLEAVKSLIAGTGAATPPAHGPGVNTRLANVASHNHSQVPQPPTQAMYPPGAAPPQQYVHTAQHYAPHLQQPLPQPPPPPPLPPKSDKWKDYVLAAGAAVGGAFALSKAWSHFSPFELRRRSSADDDAVRSPRTLRQSAAASGATKPKSSRRLNESQHAVAVSSESDERGAGQSRRASRAVAAVPLPSAPPQPPSTSGALPIAVTPDGSSTVAAQPQTKELEDRVAALEKEAADSKAALDKERREKAELAVSNGKLKGQVTQLTRLQEKSSAEVLRLTTELAALRSAAEVDKSRAAAVSTLPACDTAVTAAPLLDDDTRLVMAPAAVGAVSQASAAEQLQGSANDGSNQPAH